MTESEMDSPSRGVVLVVQGVFDNIREAINKFSSLE
jgi:hypothetical protein